MNISALHPRQPSGSAVWSLVTIVLALFLVVLLGAFGVGLMRGALKNKREASLAKEAQAVEASKQAAAAESAPAALAPEPAVAATTPAPEPKVAVAPAPAPVESATSKETMQEKPKAAAATAGDTIEIQMGVILAVLKYDKAEFSVASGKKVKIVFSNNGIQPHNMLIVKPGKLEAVGALANAMMTDPEGMAKGYIPTSEDILWNTKLLQPKESDTMEFTAPDPGDYPYLCTFPGHWMLMRGIMKVTE